MSPSSSSSSAAAPAEPLDSSSSNKQKNNNNQQPHHSVVNVLPPRIHIPARLHAFLSAWQSVDATMQNRLAAALKKGEESMYTSVLVLSLGAIPLSSTVVGAAGPVPDTIAGAAAAADNNIGGGGGLPNRCVRVSFVVLKVLGPGWSSVASADHPAPGGGNNKKMPHGAMMQGPIVKEKMARMLAGNEHALLYSFNLCRGGKAGYTRGARSDSYLVLSPGMVFTLKAWGDKIPKIFAQQTADIRPFDLAVLQVSTKSLDAKSQDALLDLRSYTPMPNLSASARHLFASSVASATLEHARVRLTQFQSAEHVALQQQRVATPPAPDSDPNHANNNNNATTTTPLPPGLNQEWIHGNLSATISLVRLVPTAGTFAMGPDDVLRFHADDQLSAPADLPCSTFLVRFDTRLYPSDTTEGLAWTIRLLNVAVLFGAVELFVAVDLYRGKDDSREPSLYSFARIDPTPFMTLIQRQGALPSVPSYIAAAFQAQGMASALPHLAVFPIGPPTTTTTTPNNNTLASPSSLSSPSSSSNNNKRHLVVDLRKLLRRPPPAPAPNAAASGGGDSRGGVASPSAGSVTASPTTTTSAPEPPPLIAPFVQSHAAWERGHNVHVFIDGRLVFSFVAPIYVAGCELLSSRVFDAIPIPKLEDQGAVYIDDDNTANSNDENDDTNDDATTTAAEDGAIERKPPVAVDPPAAATTAEEEAATEEPAPSTTGKRAAPASTTTTTGGGGNKRSKRVATVTSTPEPSAHTAEGDSSAVQVAA